MKKLAILILAHEDSKHLTKLVKALNYNSDFYIHLDEKKDIEEFEEALPFENVFFIKNRIDITWAGFTMVDAFMNLVGEALLNSNEYSHGLLITGSCYPIKNVKTIHNYFALDPKREHINFIDMRESPEHYMKLINQKWFKNSIFNTNNTGLKKIDKLARFVMTKFKLKNDWNEDVIPYFGHTWCGLTMDCWQYVFDFHNNNSWFKEMNKFTFAPDEHYIHTIVGNSPFMKNSLGKAQYKGRGLHKYVSFYLIDESLQKWYDLSDWNDIVKSDKLFVRKVNSKTGNDLVLKINEEIL